MSSSPRLGIPYLVPSQSQKEVTHNEMINMLELLLQGTVIAIQDTPPTTPTEGDLYIIGNSPTADWAGLSKYLACYIGGAWKTLAPKEGWRVWNRDLSRPIVYKNNFWTSELSASDKIGFFGNIAVSKTNVTLTTTANAIGGLSIGATYSQAEIQALKSKCETLAQDVIALKNALSSYGLL